MRIENDGYNISIEFIGRAKDGLNVWDELENDANSIEIFLGFSVQEGCGTTEGMCIPLINIAEIYNGLSMVLNNNPFSYSCNFPLINSNKEFIAISADIASNGILFFLKICDNLCDYVELTEVMTTTKFNDILLEIKGVLDKYPII